MKPEIPELSEAPVPEKFTWLWYTSVSQSTADVIFFHHGFSGFSFLLLLRYNKMADEA